MNLQEKFIQSNKHVFKDNMQFLLAVSGGKDSMLLVNLCLKAKLNFAIAHCNFQLRGDESERDEKFVADFCAEHGLTFHLKKCNTKAYAAQQKLSTQEAARNLRYSFFDELKNEHYYDYVLIAHHSLDSIETSIINLIRGTGLKGVTGIAQQRAYVYRPMLHFTKNEIEKYIKENHIQYVEDSSNLSDDYLRNHIRHHVIPAIENANENALENFSDSLSKIQDEFSLFENLIDDWKQKNVRLNDTGFAVYINDLLSTKKPATMLRMLLKPILISEEEIEKIIVAQTGSFIEISSCRILKNREEIEVQFSSEKNPNHEFYIEENTKDIHGFSFRKFDRTEDTMIDKNRFVAMLDFDKLTFPLHVRIWEKGDTFFPFGMQRKKLVSDFLTNEKLSLFEKEKTYVVLSQNEIVWIAGHRIDNRFAITESTNKIIELRKI